MIDVHPLIADGDLAGLTDAIRSNPDLIRQRCPKGWSPLYTAALHQNSDAIELLLQHGTAKDVFALVFLNHVEELRDRLDQSPEIVHQTSIQQLTPLHLAARVGNLAATSLLLDAGADVHARDASGSTAILEACHGGPWKMAGSDPIVDELLRRDFKVDVYHAAAIGRTSLLETANHAQPNSLNQAGPTGQTPLWVAAKNNRLESVRWLLDHGADVNLSNAVATAALHRISQQCSDELIQLLIDRGANAHLGCYAACGDAAGLERALSESPQRINDRIDEFNAVGYAIHSWHMDCLKTLLRHGARMSDSDWQHIRRISHDDQTLIDQLRQLGSA